MSRMGAPMKLPTALEDLAIALSQTLDMPPMKALCESCYSSPNTIRRWASGGKMSGIDKRFVASLARSLNTAVPEECK